MILLSLLLCSQVPVEGFAPIIRSSGLNSSPAVSFRTSNSQAWALFKPKETEPDVIETKGMPDLISFLQPSGVKDPNAPLRTTTRTRTNTKKTYDNDGLSEFDGKIEESPSFATVLSVAAIIGGAVLVAAGSYLGLSIDDVIHTASAFVQDPQSTMTELIEDIRTMGPAAPLFYSLLYCIAEILAIPATPLTLSAGYLFGLTQGVGVVLAGGTVAALVGFAIGKTVLRGAVEGLLQENPEFRKLDKAIGKEGFKLLVLVRLTPIFPFSISNYIYGASAIKFWPYFLGTVLGFTPSSFAYVYTGMVGQAVVTGQGDQPWYYYAAGAAVLAGLLKVVTDTATGIVKAMEEDMED